MKQHGFTLVELVVTLTLAALLLALAAPSFSRIVQANQLATATNTLVAALNLARSEAVKRGARVTLCKSDDANGCSAGGDYSQGWLVFADLDNDGAVDELMRVYEAMPDSLRAVGAGAVADYISYDADGIAKRLDGSFQAGTIAVCQADHISCIDISRAGRINLADGCSC